MTVNVTPLHDRILVTRLEAEGNREVGESSSPIRPKRSLKKVKWSRSGSETQREGRSEFRSM